MQLSISNIGMIKEAKIEMQGLTVIAGENDSGKSTVGKLLFSIIRALNKYEEEFEIERAEFVQERLERVYFTLRKKIVARENGNDPYGQLLSEFRMPHIFNEILKFHGDSKSIIMLLHEKLNLLNSLNLIESEVEQAILDIINLYSIENVNTDIVKMALSKSLLSEFDGQISNLLNKDVGIIKCTEGGQDLFSSTIEENKVKEVNCFDNIFFTDVTYIESPFVMQIHDIIDQTRFYSPFTKKTRRFNIPIHMIDLNNKIQLAGDYDFEQPFSIEDLLEQKRDNIDKIKSNIRNIIQGGVGFKKDENDFIYTKYIKGKKKKINIQSSNIAVGIKSLGIIQMLINSGILDDRSILIIDEPEVHLHPKWQIEYSRIIIEITKLGIPVLINTHSPYILQALRVFSQQEKCEKLVRYYLAEVHEGETGSVFEDVTSELHKVFKKLSDPIQDLVSICG